MKQSNTEELNIPKSVFEQQEDHYKPEIFDNVYSNKYIEYQSNADRNKILSIREYLDEIKPYLKDIINNFK